MTSFVKPAVPVVFATDDQYAAFCSVSIASLIANCDKTRPYLVYIFYDTLTQENKDKLIRMGTDNVTVEMVQVSQYVNRELLYIRDRLTITSYFRLFAGEVLPQHDKAIYLDSDVVILRDVGELYDIDIGDNLVGACMDGKNPKGHKRRIKKILKRSVSIYFNSGVLSMNLKQFRLQHFLEKCYAFLQVNRELGWMDQDTLNCLCYGSVFLFPIRWNKFQSHVRDDFCREHTLGDTAIIHYVNSYKPCLVSIRQSHIPFYQYTLLSPYREELTQKIHEANAKTNLMHREAIPFVAVLCEQGYAGPRYLFGCSKRWLRGWIERRCKQKS